MDDDLTDLDRIASRIGDVIEEIVCNTHPPPQDNSDSVTMTKDAWITSLTELGHLAWWVKSLSETHRRTSDGR